MDAAIEWQERFDALQALISGPLVALGVVAIVVAMLFTFFVERSAR